MPESTVRPVRTLRHWRQRFTPEGPFRFRRPTTIEGRAFGIGEPVPPGLLSATKLRRWWRSERIELVDFEERDISTGQPVARAASCEPALETLGGGWFIVSPGTPHAERVRGKKALEEAVARHRARLEEEAPHAA